MNDPALGDIAAPAIAHYVLGNARLPGGESVAIEIRDGHIIRVVAKAPQGLPVVDLDGATVVPGFIDSHVHLAYQYGVQRIAVGQQRLASTGIVAGVDLATPIEALPAFAGTRWLAAGPMITATLGYPTQSWGSNGYGLEVHSVSEAKAAVDTVADAGAVLIKVPLDGEPTLSDEMLDAVVTRAHDRGLAVVAHALGEADATRAAARGMDILAHTPWEPLSDATVEAWSKGAVISTLRAFGSRTEAIENLRRLHDAGATVLYGTDLGNSRVEGIDVDELDLMARAGLSNAEILAAGTSAAAEFWGMSTLGALQPGRSATLMVLVDDPLEDPTVLAEPVAVYVDGRLVPPLPATPGGFGPPP